MMKKVLAFVLVLTLVLGMLPASVLAAETGTQATAKAASDPDAPYKVGYAMVDGNPYWQLYADYVASSSNTDGKTLPNYDGYVVKANNTGNIKLSDLMPLPMGGYGNNEGRLTKPKLVDDNGSGKGAGQEAVNTKGLYYKSSGKYIEITTSTANGYSKLYQKQSDGTFVEYVNENYRDIFLDNNATENDGDGLWVTAVSVQQEGEKPLVIISVDVIGMSLDYLTYAKDAIVKKCKDYGLESDRVLINATHTHGSVDLGGNYNSTLTKTYYVDGYTKAKFTGQDIKDYLARFKPYLYNKMAEAAYQALSEATEAETMERGTIDVSEATSYQLNGVRHIAGSQASLNSPEYVRGSSFNLDIDGNGKDESASGFEAVTPSDDNMHLLRFTFDEQYEKDPVVLVNWRAHTTANNKMGTAAYYNLSSDFVSAMRYELKRGGQRAMLIYGASGNLGTGETGSKGIIPSDQPRFYTCAEGEDYGDFWVLPGTPYGRKLAEAALQLLKGEDPTGVVTAMKKVDFGPIRSQSQMFIMEHRKDTTSPLAYAAACAHRDQVNAYVTDNSVGAAKLTSYPWVWCGTYTDANGDVQVGTYVIASQYHANSLISKYGITSDRGFEINAFTFGPQVAFATVPFEASDRYYDGEGDTLAAMQTKNDWDKLGINSVTGKDEAWGTPFVMSLVDGSSGYLPNKPAYNYSEDLETATKNTVEAMYAQEIAAAKAKGVAGVTVYSTTTYADGALTINKLEDQGFANGSLKFVKGAYESHTTFAKEGTGEKVVVALDRMLEDLRDGTVDEIPAYQREKYCPVCDAVVGWTPFNELARLYSGNRLMGGHYYLAEDYTNTSGQISAVINRFCLDLNGHTYCVNVPAKDSRAFIVDDDAELNIMDLTETQSGKIQAVGIGAGAVTELEDGTTEPKLLKDGGGVILVKSGCTLNLYSGTVENVNTELCTEQGGTIRAIGTFNMYGGTVKGGKATSGGSVYTSKAFNMYGGTITGGIATSGTAATYGGNVYVAGGKFDIYGGTITGGVASSGGNVYVSTGTVSFHDGRIEAGSAYYGGGNVYVGGGCNFNMHGGTIADGKIVGGETHDFYFGGNVHVQHNNTKGGTFTMYGGTISGGASGTGPNGEKAPSVNGENVCISSKSTFRYAGGYIPSDVYMQGHLDLGSWERVANTGSNVTAITVANAATVALDGIFTGKVKVTYSGSTYTSVSLGATIGTVTEGSRIDHYNGAEIKPAKNTTSQYVGIVSGTELVVGSKPTTTYCQACDAYVVWQPYAGQTRGHYCLDNAVTGQSEVTISAGRTLCLDLKGYNYTATARAFTVEGALNIMDSATTDGTLQGTAVASKSGGTIYVAATGVVNQYGGNLTCDHTNGNKLSSGGVVCVVAGGNYTLHNGTITGGLTSGNGGNVYLTGTFTMKGGSITGGNAKLGGNVQVQNSTACFTMTGGEISGGTASTGTAICAGQTGSGFSTFRMEGGKISGSAFIQGYAVLTGTTNGTVTMTVKQPHERLTIEGKYTGKLNLTLSSTDTTYTTGSKIGISDNADISEATINVSDHSTKFVAVVGNELQLAENQVTALFVKTEPTQKNYDLGEALNTEGLVLTATYANGEIVDITEGFTVTGYHAEQAGDQIVTVSFGGMSTTFTVHVRYLTGIRIEQTPAKCTYDLGKKLDIEGLVVVGTYSDGCERVISNDLVTVLDFDPQRAGSQTLQVDCEGMRATFDVFVRAIERIEIATLPNKTTYVVDEELDPAGLTLRAIYNNRDEALITEGFTVEELDTSVAGRYPVRVTYGEFEASFDVIVEEAVGDFMVGNKVYADLDKALAASDSNNPLVLCANLDALTLAKPTYIDLNGYNVANVTTGSHKLYVMDTATADYDVADGAYGMILAANKVANVVAMTGYMSVTEGTAISFHKYQVELSELVFNPYYRAITYKSTFHGDQVVQAQIKEFGVAMRAYSAPNTTSIWADADCKTHVAMTPDQWKTGDTTDSVKSVYVSNIIDTKLETATNQARAQIDVYGRAYIQLKNGTMLFSDAASYNMKEAVEYIDYYFNSEYLSDTDRSNLVELFKDYSELMESWNIPNTKEAAGKPE